MTTPGGTRRHRVYFRTHWRSSPVYAGSFPSLREARRRESWVRDQLAEMKVPDLKSLRSAAKKAPMLREAGDRWLATRIDVAESTKTRHVTELQRIRRLLGDRRADELTPAEVAEFVAALAEDYNRPRSERRSKRSG